MSKDFPSTVFPTIARRLLVAVQSSGENSIDSKAVPFSEAIAREKVILEKESWDWQKTMKALGKGVKRNLLHLPLKVLRVSRDEFKVKLFFGLEN